MHLYKRYTLTKDTELNKAGLNSFHNKSLTVAGY